MRTKILGLMAATALALPMTANAAATRTQTGTINGNAFVAQSNVVGQTSTATTAAGGNPIYLANTAAYSGVVALIMEFSGGSFICSGTLMNDRKTIVTAAHCVTDANLAAPLKTTVYFGGGQSAGDAFNAAGTTAIVADGAFWHSSYTGEVIDQNDIAVVTLSQLAPASAISYDITDLDDLTGSDFNVAGFGRRSDAGGSVGANLGAGRLRQGINTYDFRLGDADFAGGWDGVFGSADVTYSYLSDFDNGLAANDASCLVAADFGLSGAKYCDLGLGAREVGVAGGDSGGPQFVNGKLASVTSYGLTFGADFGDFGGGLNSGFGEFSGYVPTYIHRAFLANAVPEPTTWLQMIFGFGLVGSVLRRRQSAKIAVA
jgi:V8-like Glu-specific endopeptidase